ncbi:16S rRNA (cytosine(1402)-N(4))-methyltransferase RsmH [Entomospira entomophila]|uniref:Ribosomal RNA small subunit methyltransferase H n=1 Tax=Entomospira entomophila TaxID=2719988 RepID=A0A968GAS6_9SPIO|nr:16S rRNA (cytosine(1402)-N(4))-methyltransferase RsmH [Entomospira entomophilus]NIZ39971.1 16S rRNA (cytosine(1402)-N(4))-methyltransferase RsmH [Entomospira entomophilus]WDI35532.1 16S rRNA (cytosine(1402)-N(4))-methyltransferase RsmH [Entomospira entomophilus]
MKEYQGHYSVLKQESIHWLEPNESGLWVDGTLGEAGHAVAALSAYPNIRLVGLDADKDMLQRAQHNLSPYAGRYQLKNQFFDDYFHDSLTKENPSIAILLDLGISMFHYKCAQRGFSYDDENSLDMRLNPDAPDSISAQQLLATASESELSQLFWLYAEERHSRKIAKMIVEQRKHHTITSAKMLSDQIKAIIPTPKGHYLHPAAKVFQALRIAVNKELERLERVLPASFDNLKVGGKLGVITFHSLEDRIVKHYFKTLANPCQCPSSQLICTCQGAIAKILTPKGILATDEETKVNPASRSARLRVIQKLSTAHSTAGDSA